MFEYKTNHQKINRYSNRINRDWCQIFTYTHKNEHIQQQKHSFPVIDSSSWKTNGMNGTDGTDGKIASHQSHQSNTPNLRECSVPHMGR